MSAQVPCDDSRNTLANTVSVIPGGRKMIVQRQQVFLADYQSAIEKDHQSLVA